METSSRRAFLKKAAYSAPVVVSLGAVTLPKSAAALSSSQMTKLSDYQSQWDDMSSQWGAETSDWTNMGGADARSQVYGYYGQTQTYMSNANDALASNPSDWNSAWDTWNSNVKGWDATVTGGESWFAPTAAREYPSPL